MTWGDDDLRAMEAGAAPPSPIHPAVAGVPVEAATTPAPTSSTVVTEKMPERVWCWPNFHQIHVSTGKPEWPATEYLRADLALPRPWRTAEELEALPVGSVVLTGAGRTHEKLHDLRWCPIGARWEVPSGVLGVMGPGLILYIPEAP